MHEDFVAEKENCQDLPHSETVSIYGWRTGSASIGRFSWVKKVMLSAYNMSDPGWWSGEIN